MRIGKKTSKEVAFKRELIESVTRLICTCKGVISHAELPEASVSRGTELASPPPRTPSTQVPPPPAPVQSISSAAMAGEGSSGSGSATFRHTSASFSLRDELNCAMVGSSGQSVPHSSSSGDQVFVRSKSSCPHSYF